jgi:hypothetical protein
MDYLIFAKPPSYQIRHSVLCVTIETSFARAQIELIMHCRYRNVFNRSCVKIALQISRIRSLEAYSVVHRHTEWLCNRKIYRCQQKHMKDWLKLVH